jgi:DNA-binding CsgD family transcriptional regulator
MAWRAAVRIDLNEAERNDLEARARRRKTARADAMRAQIVLLSAEGLSNVAIAERLNITRLTVAQAFRRAAAGRPGGGTPSGRATEDRRRQGHRGGDDDAGGAAAQRHSLEHALAGQGFRFVGLQRASHLAGLLPAAPPQ